MGGSNQSWKGVAAEAIAGSDGATIVLRRGPYTPCSTRTEYGPRHQLYVDRVMSGLKPEQRARVGQLWKQKRRGDRDMPNPGGSSQNSMDCVE